MINFWQVQPEKNPFPQMELLKECLYISVKAHRSTA